MTRLTDEETLALDGEAQRLGERDGQSIDAMLELRQQLANLADDSELDIPVISAFCRDSSALATLREAVNRLNDAMLAIDPEVAPLSARLVLARLELLQQIICEGAKWTVN